MKILFRTSFILYFLFFHSSLFSLLPSFILRYQGLPKSILKLRPSFISFTITKVSYRDFFFLLFMLHFYIRITSYCFSYVFVEYFNLMFNALMLKYSLYYFYTFRFVIPKPQIQTLLNFKLSSDISFS